MSSNYFRAVIAVSALVVLAWQYVGSEQQEQRARDASPVQALAGDAVVTGVLPTGGSWIVEMGTAGRKLFMIAGEAPSARVGEPVRWWVAARHLHVFDASGGRLAEADRRLGANP